MIVPNPQALLLLNVAAILATLATPLVETRQAAISGYVTSCYSDTAATFDDGPYHYTTELVDQFSEHEIAGTLFVNGHNYQCIYDETNVLALRHAHEHGWTIGSHTWSHPDIAGLTIPELSNQLDLLETALMKILGVKPALFRPPYGSYSHAALEYLNSRGYTVVGWNADTGDWKAANYDAQLEIMNSAADGTLVLAHETYAKTIQDLMPATIPRLVEKGVIFSTVDHCLGIPAYQTVATYGVRDDTWTCEGTPAPGQFWIASAAEE